MKKLICLASIASLLLWLNACKPEKNDTPAPTTQKFTVNSRLQFEGMIDGVATHLEIGKNKCVPVAYIVTSPPLGGALEKTGYEAGLEIVGKNSISAVIGSLDVPPGQMAKAGDFYSLFKIGNYNYDFYNTIVYYRDEKGEAWGTRRGVQPASSFFKIIETETSFLDTIPSTVAVINFDCTLFKLSDTTQTKKIDNAWLVAVFVAG